MAKRSAQSRVPMAVLSKAQRDKIERIEREAFLRYEGSFDELEKAIGILRLGHHLGWRPLVLMHSKRTIAKYEDILGIKVRELFDPEGLSAERSLGYKLAKKLSNFWKAVSGETSIPERKEFTLE